MNKKRVYVIAEIGINHNGLLDNCYKMIDAASRAGCEAVKLQFFKAKYLYPKSAGKLDWKDAGKRYSYDIYKAVERFEFPERWIESVMKYCSSKNIELISSVCDINGAKTLIRKGLDKIKIPSYGLTNIPLVEYCANTGRHLILSTGGATLAEVEEAVCAITRRHKNFSLLHCSIQYPVAQNNCNLGIIKTLGYAFPGVPIGYSDHTKQVSHAAVQAVYLGAEIIEKHITLDKKMEGPDHFFALEPGEQRQMVKDIRQAERDLRTGNFTIDRRTYGNTAKLTYPHEKYLRVFAFTKLFAKRDIRKGETINCRDISVLRPGPKQGGLEPKYFNLFKIYRIKAKKNINFEEPIDWDAIL